ncbi:hypothetical protein [Clostridium sp.]|nr:hypothetical protein [Clostridium sp.]
MFILGINTDNKKAIDDDNIKAINVLNEIFASSLFISKNTNHE